MQFLNFERELYDIHKARKHILYNFHLIIKILKCEYRK